jgi:radical SAM superfamily enzyme YgiQ (UPF0313 family)
MNLGIIAALTPDHWDVEILDENFEGFKFREADLVGLTALTSQVTRSYEIAEVYKKSKIKTVIGGIHASMVPEEALQFVDVVVKGEAENIWAQVISDFEHNSLKQIYQGTLQPFYQSPPPRIDLYHPGYALGNLQTTRGCPMECDFCSVHAFNGRKYRYRHVEDVVKEFTRIPQDRVYVVDDDFYGYGKRSARRAKEICRGIIDSGIKKEWYTFCSMNLSNDEEALGLMSEAGCRMILLGIESELTDQLETSKKTTNLRVGVVNYERVYEAFHRNGIAVLGSFIFGMDTDTPETIRNRTDYFINSGVDCIQPGMLTPLPGTVTYQNLLKEKRITHMDYPKDWEMYTFFNCVIKPQLMTPEEYTDLMHESWERMFDLKVIKRKYLNTLKATRNALAAGWALSTNLKYHNTVFEGQKEEYNYPKIYQELSSMAIQFENK